MSDFGEDIERPSWEDERPSTEDERPSNEDERPSNEDERQSNEDKRPSNEDERSSTKTHLSKQKTTKRKNNAMQTLEHLSEIGTEADVMMKSFFFRTANSWLRKSSGLDLRYVVFGISLFAATRTYTSKTLKWLEERGSNTLNIQSHETLAQDLELWVAQQPMNQQTLRLLCLLPSFQNMDWKNVANTSPAGWGDVDTEVEDEQQGYSGYDFVASTGRSFFSFQGKLFVMEKGESGDIKLRCFWGTSKPIQSLIKHVQNTAKHRGSLIHIHHVRGDGTIDISRNKKRSLATIDMEPKMKQELLTTLQDYFDPETEEWYFQNGSPYRKGFMFHGPPGTGKTSLYQAIAGEFNLPIYYMHLADMNDKSLHDEFQKLPKRSLVVFEELDTMGIVREQPQQAKPEPVASDDGSDASDNSAASEDSAAFDDSAESDDSHASDDSDASTDEVVSKENKKQESEKAKSKKIEKEKPKHSKVTLGALLNILDGPGAQEGRLLVVTTNAPDSLDDALKRPGRIDHKLFLGWSTRLVAAITFSRIFGTDPRLKGKFKKQELDRMARAFGEQIPKKTFTPCEIQQYCMNHRGKPEKAVAELKNWIEKRNSGEDKEEFDINRVKGTGADDSDSWKGEESWDDFAGVKPTESPGHNIQSTEEGMPETEYQLRSDKVVLSQKSGMPESSKNRSLWNKLSSWIWSEYSYEQDYDKYRPSEVHWPPTLETIDPKPIPDTFVLNHSNSADDLRKMATSSTEDDDESPNWWDHFVTSP